MRPRQETGKGRGWSQEIGNRRRETGHRRRETGDRGRRQKTGEGIQETWERRQVTEKIDRRRPAFGTSFKITGDYQKARTSFQEILKRADGCRLKLILKSADGVGLN